MTVLDDVKSKPLHEILAITKGMVVLQTTGEEIAIPYWRGAPGIAKTALAEYMCSINNMNFII